MEKKLGFWMACCLILALVGCKEHFASTETTFAGGCWDSSDTLRLEFESSDTSMVYRLVFPVTISEDYPFHNIYLSAILESPSGDMTLLPTEFVLADPTGTWLMEPEGDLMPFQLTASEGLRFNQQGKYVVRLYHFMRDLQICGVQSAGITVLPVEAP